ncbi:hypothetical protein PFISCL1PPCAC_27191, partial [Pristionchus fissidentatus]
FALLCLTSSFVCLSSCLIRAFSSMSRGCPSFIPSSADLFRIAFDMVLRSTLSPRVLIKAIVQFLHSAPLTKRLTVQDPLLDCTVPLPVSIEGAVRMR